MNQPLDLAIDVSPPRSSAYRAMAGRTRGVRIVDDVAAGAAVITDQPATAIQFTDANRYALLVDPFELPDRMAAQMEASQRVMPALTARFQPSIQPVKQALQQGKLGKPGLLRIHRWQTDAPADVLAMELDLALWMFGGYPQEIYGLERQGYRQVHLGFAEGGMALIDIDGTISPAASYYSLSMIGSSGAAYADDHHNMHLLLGARGTTALPSSGGDLALAAMIDHFAGSSLSGGNLSSDWRDVRSAGRAAHEFRLSAGDERVLVGGDRG